MNDREERLEKFRERTSSTSGEELAAALDEIDALADERGLDEETREVAAVHARRLLDDEDVELDARSVAERAVERADGE